MRWLDAIIDSMDMSLSKLREIVKEREAWRAAVPCGTELDTTEQVNHNSVLQWASDKAQGLVEFESSTILHLVGSS